MSSNPMNESKKFTDEELEALWVEFDNIPVDANDELMEPFQFFPVGSEPIEVWGWFNCQHSKGVEYLMDLDRTKQ